MDSEIEQYHLLDINQRSSSHPLTSTGMAQSPWTQVHTDFAGPFLGKMYLILIDAHSKWMKVHITSTATSAVTINKMKLTFISLGLPEILVMDNRPAFSREEFAASVKANGIRHAICVPYHPASSGLAERAVQTLKCAIKKLKKISLEDRVMKFLFKYRITLQSTTGHSPSDLLFSRRLRSNLDLLRPDFNSKVCQIQNSQKQTHDYHTQEHSSEVDDLVLAKNYRQGLPWLPGVIFNKRSSTLFLVQLADDSELQCHPYQLQHRSPNLPDVSETCGNNADKY